VNSARSATGGDGSPVPLRGLRASRTVQSVERAFDILEFLAGSEREVQLREISKVTGLNVSTCHHLLSTLVKRGYASQNPRGRTYFIGNKILELSDSRLRQFNILDIAMPELRKLNQVTGECVHLAAMQGYDLTNLAKLDSTRPVGVGTDGGGTTNAAHATATGKAILAWLPEIEIARVVAEKGLTRFTDNTITSLAELIENLRLVRRNGFSVDHEEFQPGVTSVGSAIRDHAGAVIGSIGCSMPNTRAEGEHFDAVTRAVRQSTTVMSELLGSPPERAPLKTDAA